MLAPDLKAGDFAHGLLKGQAEDLSEEVDGVAGHVPLRPAPVTFFDDQTFVSGQIEIARPALDELEISLLQQWNQRGQPGSTDLFAGPAKCWRTATTRGGCHSLSSSGVE